MSARPLPVQVVRLLVLLSHVALSLLLITTGGKLALLAGLLLCWPLPGLLRGRSYTYAWASMLLAIYCALLLADGYARPQAQHWSFGLALLAALEFVALMLYVRFSARASLAQKAGSGAASG
ncbi:Predicted membrane protein [Solimonas aquatica]|uniref:Predicted membrane protein n=1 Tax=Solimonas aquatica TaxID=489703 RepID=A0A1H9II40_9GAMM|nr:DUF2069 domain-containing protein [Solimonas aquatica]SEQ74381.1 Predicted membrane protein [Solimonas aquatica]